MNEEESTRILHELRVHQIELETQNEELRRAYAELDTVKARYFDLFELAPVGYLTISEQGLVIQANLTAVGLLGMTRNGMERQPMSRFIYREDQDCFFLQRKTLYDSGLPGSCDLRMTSGDGTPIFWVHVDLSLEDGDGGARDCRMTMSDISELKKVQDALQCQVEKEKLLMREANHRIRNNIATIASMISIQMRAVSNPEALDILREAFSRINLMEELYRKIYESSGGLNVSIPRYFGALSDSVISLFTQALEVKLVKSFDDIELRPDLIFHLGIVANELLTNAMKYAFDKKSSGTISISVRLNGERLVLTVRDDGIGLPKGFCPDESDGLGIKLIRMLAQQLGGSYCIENDKGTVCTFECGLS